MCKINGKKLGELRNKAGVSQAELAKGIGLSTSSIAKYEAGIVTPSDESVEKICMILKINKGDIEVKSVDYNFRNGESKTVCNARKRLGDKRLRMPKETESFILEYRKESEEQETNEVESKLEQPTAFAGKTYIQINPTFIHIPTWQRDTDFAKAEEIGTNYNSNKYDPIKVYVKNGKLYVADGAHRLIAAILRNVMLSKQLMIIVEVLDCDEKEARRIFLGQKAGRKDMTVNDMYRAAIENGEHDYIALKEICEENNIQITADEHIIDNPVGKMKASSSALRLANKNADLMESIIKLMKNLDWTGSEKNVFTIRNFDVMKRLYANFGNDVEEKLLENCKGAVFYESKVVPVKSNAELYDILSAEINKQRTI